MKYVYGNRLKRDYYDRIVKISLKLKTLVQLINKLYMKLSTSQQEQKLAENNFDVVAWRSCVSKLEYLWSITRKNNYA